MREDIYGGLQNALERGDSLEQAIQSFINAGYDEREVRKAASAFTEGSVSTAGLENSPGAPSPNLRDISKVGKNRQPTQLQRTKPLIKDQEIEPSKKSSFGNIMVIVLAIVLVLLIGALVATIFFKQDILELIGSFF